MAPASRAPAGHVKHVDEAAARVANGRDDALEAALAGVLDDDAGVRREVRAEVGIDSRRIGDGHRHAVVDETPSQRTAFDQELDLKSARQDPVERPNDQLVLTDGQRTHSGRL